MRVLDLGCSPGSWLQYARTQVGPTGVLVGLDRNAQAGGTSGARVEVGDVLTIDIKQLLGDLTAFDVVLSDMAPDTSGVRSMDQARSEALFERALADRARDTDARRQLRRQAVHGPRLQEAVRRRFALAFASAKMQKPDSSRQQSIEHYVIGKGFKK